MLSEHVVTGAVRQVVRAGVGVALYAFERLAPKRPPPPVDDQDLISRLERELERAKERGDRLFGVVQLMEEDRDRWKMVFFEQAREHVAAQAMLECAIERSGHVVEKLVAVVNGWKKNLGEDPLDIPTFIRDADLGFSARYAQRLRDAVAAMPADTTRPVDLV
jgi:hypothetical protein